jgi:hypothetical protein
MADTIKTPASAKGAKGSDKDRAATSGTASGPAAAVSAPQIPGNGNGNGNGGAATEEAAPKAKRGKREQLQELFDTEEQAVETAQGRQKGPRRAFKVTAPDGKAYYAVHNNEGRALGAVAAKCGFTAEELGKKARASKPVTVDGVLAAVNSLPEAERAAVLAQLKALTGGK